MIVKANASLAAQGNTTIKSEQAFALTVQEVDMLEVLVPTHLVIALFVNLGATHRTMGNRAAKYVRKGSSVAVDYPRQKPAKLENIATNQGFQSARMLALGAFM